MSFRVYGMTDHQAYLLARRLTPPQPTESVSEFEERVAQRAEKILDGKRSVPLSTTYDAPQFCREFIALAQRSCRCRGLHIRRPVTVEVTRRGRKVETTTWQEC